jgi:HlyD family secretion protein
MNPPLETADVLRQRESLTAVPALSEPPRQPMASAPTSASPRPVRQAGRVTKPRRWLPYLGGAALVAAIVWGFWPQPAPVETARASFGLLRTTVNEEGKTRIRQRYTVSAPVTGHLRRIPFKAGAEIETLPATVAVIDPLSPALLDARTRSLAEARRDTAAAQSEKARAAQHFAASELRRIEKLRQASTVSEQDLENAQWREISSSRELAAAESALREAEAELQEFTFSTGAGTNSVRSPVPVNAPTQGRVLRVFEESSRVVTAGMPLLEMGDPTDLEVVIECLSRDGAMIHPGTPVELEHWGGRRPLKARVRLVEPAAFTKVSALGVEEQRVNVVADLLTPPGERGNLGDQFRVEARIITWQSDRALKVPAGALFRRGQQWCTFVLQNGRAHLRLVTPGHTGDSESEITDGLREGEEVILYPGDRVTDGLRVRPLKF